MGKTDGGGHEGRTIKAVTQAFAVIETLAEMDGGRLTELSTELDIPNSTAHAYLQTLVETGYVRREGKTYHLGLRFLEQGGEVRRQYKLHRVGRGQVDDLAAETGEVASLGVEDNGRRVLLYKAEGSNAVYDNPPVGEFTNMHWTALGKAILSGLPTTRVQDIVAEYGLPERTAQTITNEEDLQSELEGIRDQGYSLEDEEREVGVRSVAVPLSDASDDVIGAVSLSGPQHRFDDEWIHGEAVPMLQNAANVIELQYLHD